MFAGKFSFGITLLAIVLGIQGCLPAKEQLSEFVTSLFSGDIIDSFRQLFSLIKVKYSNKTELDIFAKGMEFFKLENWQQAYKTFTEAWELFNSTDKAEIPHNIREIFIVDYLQFTAYKLGRLSDAHMVCLYALKHVTMTEEERTKMIGWKAFYDYELSITRFKEMYKNFDSLSVNEQIKIAEIASTTKQYSPCQDDIAHKAMNKLSENAKLFCRYDNRKRHPLLMLSPVKEEILSLSPLVIVVYGIITPQEIINLKMSATGSLQSAKLYNRADSSVNFQDHKRKARTAVIENRELPSLTARLEALLRLNPYDDGCEMYQVAHYNIGGHYRPHYDILFNDSSGLGDRIATLLLYLNDVEQGGGTVFNNLGIRVRATKGAGLFWFNFHKNETANMKTVHSACPVIRGEKWVVNKWFRWRGQFLNQPHGLKLDDDFGLEDLSPS